MDGREELSALHNDNKPFKTWSVSSAEPLSWHKAKEILSHKSYLFSGTSDGSTRKLRFTMISWANFKLDRSRAEVMTSSSVIVFGGLAVDTRPKQSPNELNQKGPFIRHTEQDLNLTLSTMFQIKHPDSKKVTEYHMA